MYESKYDRARAAYRAIRDMAVQIGMPTLYQSDLNVDRQCILGVFYPDGSRNERVEFVWAARNSGTDIYMAPWVIGPGYKVGHGPEIINYRERVLNPGASRYFHWDPYRLGGRLFEISAEEAIALVESWDKFWTTPVVESAVASEAK